MASATFVIQGIAPPDVRSRPPEDRMVFWWAVVEFGLRRKDWELARGWNAKGARMPAVKPETAERRRSEMGLADRKAPYLMPARKLSRTRSLLTGKATPNRAVFTWAYDKRTGDSWARILEYHRRRGSLYDVIGLSPQGRARVAAQAKAWWRKWLQNQLNHPKGKGKPKPPAATPAAKPAPPKKTIAAMQPTRDDPFGFGVSDGPNPFDAPSEPVVPKAAPTPKPAPKPKETPKPGEWPESLKDVRVVRSLGGSTGAQLVEDAAGNRYVLKKGAHARHLNNEVAADAMYRAAGLHVPESKVYRDAKDEPVKLARYVEGRTLGQLQKEDPKAYRAAVEKAREGFAVDALLGNWDVVGADADNLIVAADGTVHRIDNGGALAYRAQGKSKSKHEFAPWNVHEVESMRDSVVNPSAARVFADLDDAALAAQAKRIAARRQDILDAAPKGLRGVVEGRLDALERYAATRDAGWEPTPAAEFKGAGDDRGRADARWSPDYKGWLADLTAEQRRALKEYTGNYYESVNRTLRGERPMETYVQEIVDELDAAMRSTPLPEGRVVYRGFRDPKPVLDALGVSRPDAIRPGMEYVDPGYKSTSAARDAAFNATDARKSLVLEIRLPQGSEAAYIRSASIMDAEYEVLVGRELDVFRVVEVKDDGTVVVEAMRSRDVLQRGSP